MSKNRILYLTEKDFVSMLVTEEEMTKIYSVRSEINNIAKNHFLNIKEYHKLVRKKLLLKNKIPIYFSQSLLLFYINSNKTIFWINYYMILKICYDKNIVIFFKDGSMLELEISKRVISNELKKIYIVLEHINNL